MDVDQSKSQKIYTRTRNSRHTGCETKKNVEQVRKNFIHAQEIAGTQAVYPGYPGCEK